MGRKNEVQKGKERKGGYSNISNERIRGARKTRVVVTQRQRFRCKQGERTRAVAAAATTTAEVG